MIVGNFHNPHGDFREEGALKTYRQANEIIEKNQEAVILFTHGPHFSYDPAGNGETGKSVVDPDNVENVDKVIVYLRREDENVNRIFRGNYAGIRKSDLPGSSLEVQYC